MTEATTDHVQIYRDDAGEYRWRRIAANGEKVSVSGEGFTRREWAEKSARNYNRDVTDFRGTSDAR